LTDYFRSLFQTVYYFLFSATPISLLWNTTGVTVAGVTGINGAAANQLNTPARITMDSFDSLYIADFDNHRIQKYLLNATSGTTIAGLPNATSCSSAICLNYPTDVAVDSNGNIYIPDSDNQRLQLWAAGAIVGITVDGNGEALFKCN
jgi:DNA-binding beta-propeller fold protein YncE